MRTPKHCLKYDFTRNIHYHMKISQGKFKTMPMQTFWGLEAVYYGIAQVVNEP